MKEIKCVHDFGSKNNFHPKFVKKHVKIKSVQTLGNITIHDSRTMCNLI